VEVPSGGVDEEGVTAEVVAGPEILVNACGADLCTVIVDRDVISDSGILGVYTAPR
jgi:hypothetical protein